MFGISLGHRIGWAPKHLNAWTVHCGPWMIKITKPFKTGILSVEIANNGCPVFVACSVIDNIKRAFSHRSGKIMADTWNFICPPN